MAAVGAWLQTARPPWRRFPLPPPPVRPPLPPLAAPGQRPCAQAVVRWRRCPAAPPRAMGCACRRARATPQTLRGAGTLALTFARAVPVQLPCPRPPSRAQPGAAGLAQRACSCSDAPSTRAAGSAQPPAETRSPTLSPRLGAPLRSCSPASPYDCSPVSPDTAVMPSSSSPAPPAPTSSLVTLIFRYPVDAAPTWVRRDRGCASRGRSNAGAAVRAPALARHAAACRCCAAP